MLGAAVLMAFALWSFLSPRSRTSEAVGQAAPDFEFDVIGGKTQRLSDLLGQVVIVDFFATWCPPCLAELPELDRKIAKPFAKQGLVVVAVGLDDNPKIVQRFQRENDYSFWITADPTGQIVSRFTQDEGIPQTFLIRPDGTIAMHLTGYDPADLLALRREVEKLLSGK